MKRAAAIGFCLLCLPGCLGASAACTTLVILSELKQQAPERLQMTVTTQDGNTIAVDAPIVLPDGDTLPIVLAQRATFDTTGLHDVYPFPDFFNQEYSQSSLRLMLEQYDHPDNVHIHFYAEEWENKLTGGVDSTTRGYLPQGETPPENDVTVEEIMAFIAENIKRFDCDAEPDLRVLKATAKTGQYAMKTYKTPEGWTEYTINENKPVKSASKGIWDLELAQYMYGARIFGYYLPYASCDYPENPNRWQSPVSFHAQYMDEKNFNIILSFLKETACLANDAPLLSYDSLVEALRNRMREGKLKSIYGLTLGYSVKIVKGDAFYTDDNINGWSTDVRFVLAPEWEILGFDEQDAATARSVGIEEPTKEMILEPERCSRYGLSYNVRMDAATGEFILDYEAMEYDLAQ